MKKISKPTGLTLCIAVLLCSSALFFQSCTKESSSEEAGFLYIADVNKAEFTPAEWKIIKEADKRMSAHLIIDGTQLSLGGTTAKELKIDQRLFDK